LEWASSKEAPFGLQVCNMHQKYSSCIFDNGDFSGIFDAYCKLVIMVVEKNNKFTGR
jgi:hypothetical protein